MNSLFDLEDYKDFIQLKVRQNKAEKAYQSQLAEAAGCQKSFFSQVLNSHVHLTPDHAAGLCNFWGLNESETDYFFLLVLLARAGSPKLVAMLRRKIKAIQQKRSEPTERFNWPKLSDQEQFVYYSSWYVSALHIIVSIDRYHSVTTIADRLGLPHSTVESGLSWLEDAGLIKKKGKGWVVTEKAIYLPKTSPMNEAHHLSWRQRAMLSLQRREQDAIHYSAVLALARNDFEKLKSMIVDSVDEMNRVAAPSASEEIVAFTCDFFRV